MSLNLIARLHADHHGCIMQACRAFFEEWDLNEKFKIIASRLRAEPLGLCLLIPEVDYPIVKIKRLCIGVLVHVKINGDINNGKALHDLLPRTHGEIVTEADIEKINSCHRRFTIIRKIKKCGPNRIRFDHKSYTWDLHLRRV